MVIMVILVYFYDGRVISSFDTDQETNTVKTVKITIKNNRKKPLLICRFGISGTFVT